MLFLFDNEIYVLDNVSFFALAAWKQIQMWYYAYS